MNLKPFQFGKFKGVIDFTDFAVVERFEAALEDFHARIADAENNNTTYKQSLKAMFDAVTDLLESTLGEGASNQVLGSTTSMNEAMGAFQALVDYRHAQDLSVSQDWMKTAEKYSPKSRPKARAAK